ncbi:3-deoxy-manno-octulosonate cytidylyltransferase [Methylobacterium sp. J-076]|uniref:3-deoxy-manno-octulosonate cytidylyltransferase n=1 Tax=Methylobacterium sp. J-076 TaxID=2836655 RepID=UPI001FBAFB71|nr:3-deoxy-manno-octulosonate cytidylyltransferase [Methylobacterium sp. J-076]MCJ2014880.1 3-deoxy-manno-octulosonate cytidylyltransferase [Methylobacterium sp. J-076]
MSDPLVLIPARLAATRLPNKPLADIAGEPMILHVWRRAVEAGIGPVVVATDAPEIVRVIEAAGGLAVMTQADHPSGSDRLAEALESIDPEGRHDVVVNVQGDLPTIDPAIIAAALLPLADRTVDIATLCAPITDPEEADNPNVVKIVGHEVGPRRLRALYFTRARAPYGPGPLWHHIGLYAYRRKALVRFVALPPGALETREKLEQLRALEAGMRIDAMVVDDLPLGVDTPADLDKARALMLRRRLN